MDLNFSNVFSGGNNRNEIYHQKDPQKLRRKGNISRRNEKGEPEKLALKLIPIFLKR